MIPLTCKMKTATTCATANVKQNHFQTAENNLFYQNKDKTEASVRKEKEAHEKEAAKGGGNPLEAADDRQDAGNKDNDKKQRQDASSNTSAAKSDSPQNKEPTSKPPAAPPGPKVNGSGDKGGKEKDHVAEGAVDDTQRVESADASAPSDQTPAGPESAQTSTSANSAENRLEGHKANWRTTTSRMSCCYEARTLG